jgi:hypothetical protein
MTEPVELGTSSVPFTMLGAADAAACEGESGLVVLPSAAGASSDGAAVDEPGRRGVSR